MNSAINNWSQYWREGNEDSIPDWPQQYRLALEEFWLRTLQSTVADMPFSCLEVGCGNGGLIKKLYQWAREADYVAQFTGIDLAKINPLNLCEGNTSATTSGEVPMESCRSLAQNVDIAISQFAIEYSNMALSLEGIFHSLKTGAQLICIAHSETSVFVQEQRKTYLALVAINRDRSIQNGLQQLVEKPSDQPATKALKSAVCALMQGHQQGLQNSGILDAYHYFLTNSPNMDKAQRKQLYQQITTSFAVFENRLADMMSATIDQSKLQWLAKTASDLGYAEFFSDNYQCLDQILGIRLVFTK
jgi:hypothetical protein